MQMHPHAPLLLALLPVIMASSGPQTRPFAVGERLSYGVHAGPAMNGRGEMWIAGPVDVHGTPAMALHSEITGGFGPFKVPPTSATLARSRDSWSKAQSPSDHFLPERTGP